MALADNFKRAASLLRNLLILWISLNYWPQAPAQSFDPWFDSCDYCSEGEAVANVFCDMGCGMAKAAERVGAFFICMDFLFPAQPSSDPVKNFAYECCNKVFPFDISNCTLNGQSVDNANCSDDALVSWIDEGVSTGAFKAECQAQIQQFINTSKACGPVIAANSPQPYLDQVQQLLQPFLDVTCVISQLGAAELNNANIFLPGCDPTTVKCQDPSYADPYGNPYYYMAANLIWSYSAGYLFSVPIQLQKGSPPYYQNPSAYYSISDYIYDWYNAQTFAAQGTDQAGNAIIAQINVFDPNSFLNATNNTSAQVDGDLQLALGKMANLLTQNKNNLFPGTNPGLINPNLATMNCDPNILCPNPGTNCATCCNPPSMSLPDAQIAFMNTLNEKMTDILTQQQTNPALIDYFQTNTIFSPIDPTKIPPLAEIDEVGMMMTPTGTNASVVNGQTQPACVGKVVTNWLTTNAQKEATKEYISQAFLTSQILLTATDVNNNVVSCAPGNLQQVYKTTMQTCVLSVEQLAPYEAAANLLVSLLIFGVIFKTIAALTEFLSSMELGVASRTLSIISGVWKVGLVLGMLIGLSGESQTWLHGLPQNVQDGINDFLSPPLNIIVPANLQILEQQLECRLNETLIEFDPTSTGTIAQQVKACRAAAAGSG